MIWIKLHNFADPGFLYDSYNGNFADPGPLNGSDKVIYFRVAFRIPESESDSRIRISTLVSDSDIRNPSEAAA